MKDGLRVALDKDFKKKKKKTFLRPIVRSQQLFPIYLHYVLLKNLFPEGSYFFKPLYTIHLLDHFIYHHSLC